MNFYRLVCIFCLYCLLLGCEDSGTSDPAQCLIESHWRLMVTRIETSGCALTNCGHGGYNHCTELTLLEIKTQEEEIYLEPMIAGLLSGYGFRGQIHENQILATHELYFNSEIKAKIHNGCQIEAEILWDPADSCQAIIEFIANK